MGFMSGLYQFASLKNSEKTKVTENFNDFRIDELTVTKSPSPISFIYITMFMRIDSQKEMDVFKRRRKKRKRIQKR